MVRLCHGSPPWSPPRAGLYLLCVLSSCRQRTHGWCVRFYCTIFSLVLSFAHHSIWARRRAMRKKRSQCFHGSGNRRNLSSRVKLNGATSRCSDCCLYGQLNFAFLARGLQAAVSSDRMWDCQRVRTVAPANHRRNSKRNSRYTEW